MSSTEETYINKKDQAPSYCDRCLFKSNLSTDWSADFYRCLHNCFGSDHRPVQLGITLKDFNQPKFQDVSRILDMQNPRQGYGEITIQLVSITNLDFEKSFILKKFINPFILSEATEP